jgi:uncharacterized repeat protein (TIGR01451 family)
MEKAIVLEKLKRTQFSGNILSLLIAFLLQLCLIGAAKADFINGGFESPYSPSGTVTTDPITGWTLRGYTFNGSLSTTLATSISSINLSAATTPGGITDIYDASNISNPDDYFLKGAIPAPTLLLPGTGLQTASINLRSGHAPLTKSGTTAITGWVAIGKQATSVSQQITIQPSDIDPIDNKVHVRFIAAPVLENPAHTINEQPFFAIQLNNITTGRIGSNPLFFQWNFASQPGTPWKDLTAGAGTNLGSNTSYQYTDWQAFDMSPGNAFIHVGDTIEVVVMASGCSRNGHDGHVYLDDVHTTVPSGLWVAATGPASTTPGSTVTYTYTYTNNGSTPVSNVQVVANLPQGTPPLSSGVPGPVTPAQNTTFVSNTNPTTGSCSGTGPVTCSIGTLQPGQTGTFTVTVVIPGSWVTTPDGTNTSGPVNNGNYPISGTGVAPLLGPLVQTTLLAPSALSNLIANTSGMSATAVAGTPYSGSFTCANASNLSATGDAPNASCDITNLPPGLAVSQCTITPSGAVWTQPATIPANQTVTCDVTGTPTTSGAFTATVTTNAANNSNSTGNTASAPITLIGSGSVADMVATLSLPTEGSVLGPYTGSFTCTNNSAVTATSVHCSISGLPAGVSVSSCSSPTLNPWVDGSSLPAQQAITCRVSGTPQSLGNFTATVSTSASNQINTSNDTLSTPINVGNKAPIPATLNGSRVLNSAIACCGRPVILHNLAGSGKTKYKITARTGNVRCVIGRSGSKTYLKINGRRGSCTVVGTKNGITTLPLTVSTPSLSK